MMSPPLQTLPKFDVPIVVETDASIVAVGAVLAQNKGDRKVHSIQYASRTMKAAEKNYSACEREALAQIFALKKFCVDLLSTHNFRAITDQQVLQYAIKNKDVYSMLAR